MGLRSQACAKANAGDNTGSGRPVLIDLTAPEQRKSKLQRTIRKGNPFYQEQLTGPSTTGGKAFSKQLTGPGNDQQQVGDTDVEVAAFSPQPAAEHHQPPGDQSGVHIDLGNGTESDNSDNGH